MSDSEAAVFAALARQLASESDAEAILRRITQASVANIAGAQHAGVTMISQQSATTPVATDDLVRTVDHRQYTAGEGPCLSAALGEELVVRVDDLQNDSRWPAFAAAIADLPVRSMLSFQLYTPRGAIGALNVYAPSTAAFTDPSVHIGTLLAAHAAAAASAALINDSLRTALKSRDVIGQAKGILMERFKIDSAEAFDLLIAASQRSHRKLRDVADTLAATGELVIE
jgi:transcriptional regulator with GAF, ATPase, and Fis domain